MGPRAVRTRRPLPARHSQSSHEWVLFQPDARAHGVGEECACAEMPSVSHLCARAEIHPGPLHRKFARADVSVVGNEPERHLPQRACVRLQSSPHPRWLSASARALLVCHTQDGRRPRVLSRLAPSSGPVKHCIPARGSCASPLSLFSSTMKVFCGFIAYGCHLP